MNNKKINCTGQGVGENTLHCFILDLTTDSIRIHETYDYSTNKGDLKASISKQQWDNIKDKIFIRINNFIKENNYKKNRFLVKGVNYIEATLGKEIALLFWGVEETENTYEIEQAIRNWRGLDPMERCYLYTMTNGNLSKDINKGWRGAVKKILIEN